MPILDVACLARIESSASATMQPLLDAIGIVTKPVGHAIADPVSPVEAVDLPLDIVEPHLKLTDLAKAVTIAVAVDRRVVCRPG